LTYKNPEIVFEHFFSGEIEVLKYLSGAKRNIKIAERLNINQKNTYETE
jgi:DNA-binding NarL/FixJ family response regulator